MDGPHQELVRRTVERTQGHVDGFLPDLGMFENRHAFPFEEADPTTENPWVVQEFIEGVDRCSFSVVREGRVQAHVTYAHPKTIDGAGGIVFESIDDHRTLRAAQRIAEATNDNGQLSLDFIDDGERLHVIECNPRPTAGVCLMPERMFVETVLGPVSIADPMVVPGGRRRCIRSALVRELFLSPRSWFSNLREILSVTPDVYFDARDRKPSLYQFVSLVHSLKGRLRSAPGTSKLSARYLHDVCWDGKTEQFDDAA